MLKTVALVCGGIVAALAYTEDDRRQLETSDERLRNINRVVAEANRLHSLLPRQRPEAVFFVARTR